MLKLLRGSPLVQHCTPSTAGLVMDSLKTNGQNWFSRYCVEVLPFLFHIISNLDLDIWTNNKS